MKIILVVITTPLIIIITIIIIITRPKPAFGRLGLGGSSEVKTLGEGKISKNVTDIHTDIHFTIIYISSHHHHPHYHACPNVSFCLLYSHDIGHPSVIDHPHPPACAIRQLPLYLSLGSKLMQHCAKVRHMKKKIFKHALSDNFLLIFPWDQSMLAMVD